jgi:hypothetical protein
MKLAASTELLETGDPIEPPDILAEALCGLTNSYFESAVHPRSTKMLVFLDPLTSIPVQKLLHVWS